MQQQENAIRLIVGLGNPGAEYQGTRHNAGFSVVDRLLGGFPVPFTESHRCESRCFAGRFRGRSLLLQKPLTFMNLSGKAVAPLARKEGIGPAEIMVVSDDLDLPLGEIRIRRGGGAGGHHGLESVIEELGSADFLRLRVGIGRSEPGETVDFVLSKCEGEEAERFQEAIGRAAEAALTALTGGVSRAMTAFNRKVSPTTENENQQEQPRTPQASDEKEVLL